MFEIRCKVDDVGNEYLPNFEDTELWDRNMDLTRTKRQEQLVLLYNAIQKMENYWYFNTPTAFGNSEQSMNIGFVKGMIAGLGWNYSEVNNEIIVKSGKRIVLKIQKPKKSKTYFETSRENADLMRNLGL